VVGEQDLADELRAAIALLEAVVADPSKLGVLSAAERSHLLIAAGNVFCPDVEERRQQVRARRRRDRAERLERDERVLDATAIRRLRAKPVYVTPDVFAPAGFEQHEADDPDLIEVREPQHCYVCKQKYTHVHHFYDQLCPSCGDLNFRKRTESADLRGRVALLTGGRVKIGYQAGIKLLRAGADLVVTTRFPRDAALRYAQEADFRDWSHRLEIVGLDLRHTPSVEELCRYLLGSRSRLDVIVNNACQTVRRPPDFYRHMMELETAAAPELSSAARALLGGPTAAPGRALDSRPDGLLAAMAPEAVGGAGGAVSAHLSQARLLPDEWEPASHLFPEGSLDQDRQQVDLRDRNSWRLTLAEVSTVELLETQLVNAVAPFVLNARLKPLLLRSPEPDRHIVNVSAVEGQFYRRLKTTRHPHTNMAKAALNMMTRTSAADYHADGIHMNAVDTGWVSDEDPADIAARKTAEHRFHPPLDIVDGAARVVDPVFSGVNTGEHVHGQFLKDYLPTDW
jgi:NAD(P)-dependent dehydrogenase (short-subunit alcohol dehydrogenase family)